MLNDNLYAHVFKDRTTTIMVAIAAVFAVGSIGWLMYAVVQKRLHLGEQPPPPRVLTVEEKKAILEDLASRQPTKDILTPEEKLRMLHALAASSDSANVSESTNSSDRTTPASSDNSTVQRPAHTTKPSLSQEEKLRILQELQSKTPSQ